MGASLKEPVGICQSLSICKMLSCMYPENLVSVTFSACLHLPCIHVSLTLGSLLVDELYLVDFVVPLFCQHCCLSKCEGSIMNSYVVQETVHSKNYVYI